MEFRKCHFFSFFSCGTMKFFLFLLFLLLLFDSPQGSTILHKRSIRALNTTLETNFNGTYERRNPCTNAEIETTSYVASHEFHHHTEENNWSDYTHKCSSIISSFLQALGNLIHFNHKQNGIFNFHINTSISQKQDGQCDSDKRPCNTLPTITIEATDCELSPRLPSDNPSGEQLCQDEYKQRKDLLSDEIGQRSQVVSEETPRTRNFNQNSAQNMPQCHTEDEITSVSSLDSTATEDKAKPLEEENAWTLDDILLPATETVTSLESDYPTVNTLMGTNNSPQRISDPSENAQTNLPTEQYPNFFKPALTLTSQLNPENYVLSQGTEPRKLVDPEKLAIKASESFNIPSLDHPRYLPQASCYGHETTLQPIAAEKPFYRNQFSDLPFSEPQPTADSKQLFQDNFDRQVFDSKFLPNQQPDNTFASSDQIPTAPFSFRKPNPIEAYQEKNPEFEAYPFSLRQRFPFPTGQNKESFQQSPQSRKEPDYFESTRTRPNTEISSETETTSHLFQKYLPKYEEDPFNQISNRDLPQVPNLKLSERQFMDYERQTPTLGFSASYPMPPLKVPPIKSGTESTFSDHNSKEATKEKAQAINYPDEFLTAPPLFERNLGSPASDDIFPPNDDQVVPFVDDLSTSSIRKPLIDSTWTPNERSPVEKPFYDENDNQFLSTESPKRPPFYLNNESPFSTSDSQKSILYYSEEDSGESSIDKVPDGDLSLPSDQHQSTARPESQSLLNYPNQYDNVEEVKPESDYFDPLELTTGEHDLQSYSTTPENQANSFTPFNKKTSPLRYPTDTTSNQKFSSSYDSTSTSDYESFSPSESKTFSDEYLTTLPPQQDSFENSQRILTTFDPYQGEPSFPKTQLPSPLEGKFAEQILNDGAMLPIPDASNLNSEKSTNDISTSRAPAPTSFDDYQNSFKPDIEPISTTPLQNFNENTYEPATEPYFIDNRKYPEESYPTTPTIFGIDQLKQQPSSYSNQNSDVSLEQPLNYASDFTPLPTQNYDTLEPQPRQFFQEREDLLPVKEPFSDQQHNDFPTEPFKTDSFMNYDSELPPDLFVPQTEQTADDSVFISGHSKQNPNVTPYFAEDFFQENKTSFSPQPFMPYNNEGFSPDRSFGDLENTPPPEFSTADDYSELITAKNYQKPELPVEFPKDSDVKSKKFFSELFTTPLPPSNSLSEDFSSPSNYKTISGNSLAQNQAEESIAPLDQSVGGYLPSQFEESSRAFPGPFRDVSKFDADFQVEKNFKQPFETATAEEEPTQSITPVNESQNDQSFSYSDGTEPFNPYAEKQYVAADQPKAQTVFFPDSKSLMSELPEYGSATSSEYQPVEEPVKTELYKYSINNSDNFESVPAVDQQTEETNDQESTQNNSNQFSDFYPKGSSPEFFLSAERPLIRNSPDSFKEQTEFYLKNRQPASVVLDPQSLLSPSGNDQSRSMKFQFPSTPESQSESIMTFSDDKTLSDEKTPIDISSQSNPLASTKNQELQSNDFQNPDFLAFPPYSQPQMITSNNNYALEDFSEGSQSSSAENLDSIVSPESHFTKPETYRNMNRASNRQAVARPLRRKPETYNRFLSGALLQPTKFYDKEVVPNNEYSSTLKSTPQIELPVYDYNKPDPNPYLGPNFAPKLQPYQYQSESPPQTLLEEYSDIIPTAETEIPFNIDKTTKPSVFEISPSQVNEQSQSQNFQEEMSDNSSLTSELQLKPQPSNDYLPGEKTAEKPIQTSNFENTPFFEVKPDKSVARGSIPIYTEHEPDAAGSDYNQPKSRELDYLDESFNTNFDVPIPDYLNNPVQSSIAPPPSDSVSIPDVQFRSNDFSSFPQSQVSNSYQLNNNSNEPSQQSSVNPLRYPQLEKDISFVIDNASPQTQPTTAVYNDEEIIEMSPTSKSQPQTSLNFENQFYGDNISEQLPDSPDQQHRITPNVVISSEFEPSFSAQRKTPDFGTSDKDASNQPSFLLQPQTRQLDAITGSPDQIQNNFDPKLSSETFNASPLYSATQSQREPSIINTERPYNSQEQFSPYNRYESHSIVDSNNRPLSTGYQQDPPLHPVVYDRSSSNISPLEPRYFNKAFPYRDAQSLNPPRFGQRSLDPREKFQTQPYIPRSSRYPISDFPINMGESRFPPIIPRHSASQRFDPQSYPINFPNQYPYYNSRARPNVSTSNFYYNEPTHQTNRPLPQYFTSDAMQAENLFERPLPSNLGQYPNKSEVERSPDQTLKNADSPPYDDYDQILPSQLPKEELEYNEDITPEFNPKNFQMVQTHRQQSKNMVEQDLRKGSDDLLTEENFPLGLDEKPDSYDFQDKLSPSNESPSFQSTPAEKEPHSNPLLQTLESHFTFPFHEHLHPSASHASFEDTEKESPNDSFDPQNQNKFREASTIPRYSEGRDSELDFVNYQPSQPLSGVDTAQGVNTRQPDSQALVSDPNIPSNEPGEDCVSCSGQYPIPLLCPFDPILKGNMTAPSYYILISKLPVDDDKEERFKVEKVYLGDGLPLNCTLSIGKTFPTSLYTSIPFSAAGTVKLRTKSDFA